MSSNLFGVQFKEHEDPNYVRRQRLKSFLNQLNIMIMKAEDIDGYVDELKEIRQKVQDECISIGGK